MALAQGPMAKEWVLSLLHQCRKQRVKFFFKLWGRCTKATTGRTLNVRTYNELPARTIISALDCNQRSGAASKCPFLII